MRNKTRTGGFTLIELIVVLAVMTILAGITVPNLSAYAQNAREIERADHEKLVQKSIRQYYAYEGNYPDLTGLAPENGSLTLNAVQEEQLRDKLFTVTSARINITDYQVQYNEKTGGCTITQD